MPPLIDRLRIRPKVRGGIVPASVSKARLVRKIREE
jgi:hypothetical protein